jgi:hypothetical protein
LWLLFASFHVWGSILIELDVFQAIGAEYGEGFETFRTDGPLKVDVVRNKAYLIRVLQKKKIFPRQIWLSCYACLSRGAGRALCMTHGC